MSPANFVRILYRLGHRTWAAFISALHTMHMGVLMEEVYFVRKLKKTAK